MVKIIIILTVITAFILYVYTRDTSMLTLVENKLTISVNNNIVSFDVEEVNRKKLQLNRLTVIQTILKLKDQEFLVFETSEVDIMYQYNFSTQNTVYKLLNAHDVNVIFQANNLYLIQAKLQNLQIINIIAKQSDYQSLSMLYGFSNKEFIRIIDIIKNSNKSLEKEIEPDIMILTTYADAVKTEWNNPLNIIDGLIVPSDKE